MEGRLIYIGDLQAVLKSHLQKTNASLAEKTGEGDIVCAVDGLEFSMPMRDTTIEGKTGQFILLAGKMEPSDRLARIVIAPCLEISSPRKSVRS